MGFNAEIIQRKWRHTDNGCESSLVGSGFKMANAFYKEVKFINPRSQYECIICKTKFGKGVACMGHKWERFCFNCAFEVIKNAQTDLDELKGYFSTLEQEYAKNKTKWTKKAVIEAL